VTVETDKVIDCEENHLGKVGFTVDPAHDAEAAALFLYGGKFRRGLDPARSGLAACRRRSAKLSLKKRAVSKTEHSQ
jgi:hypothetical protein